MNYRYAFVLGRPGCGKSALYRELEQRILGSGKAMTVERVDDFPILWAKVQADNAREKAGKEMLHFSRTDDGDLCLIDGNTLDLILEELAADLMAVDKAHHLVVVEFSRPNYVDSLQIFPSRIIEDCVVIYMEVSFETCWARNVARHKAAAAEGGDDHLVPRGEMERRFLHDDQHRLVPYSQEREIPLVVVNNEAHGEEHLREQVERLYQELFRAEPAARGEDTRVRQ